jgi:glutathione S-transferase
MYLLHYAPDNASLVIRLVLEEAGLPYRAVLVDRARNAQNSDAYRQINPAGRIPTLETPQGPIFETGAILLWLADRHGLGPTENEAGRLVLLKWLFFLSNTLHADLIRIFYPERYVEPQAMPGHSRLMIGRLREHFALVDTAATTTPRLFAPGGVLAPYIACLMRWAMLYPEGGPRWFDPAGYPALEKMARQLEARAATQRLIRAEGLGPTPFTAPVLAAPPEGSAT